MARKPANLIIAVAALGVVAATAFGVHALQVHRRTHAGRRAAARPSRDQPD